MLVSAIVPTYNRAHMIEKTIDSILNQSYPNMEVIIVDDGSSDNTEEVVRRYLHEPTTQIHFYKKPNGGCASARNKGVDLASGEYIAFLDSDDQWLPNAIDSMMKTLLETGADFVYSPTIQVINTIDEFTVYPAASGRPDLFAREHFLTNLARSSAILYKRNIFEKLRIDERLRYNEDSDFLQKVALNFKGAYSPLPTAKVFLHETNKSRNRVLIYQALLSSSENILADFPDFAKSLGEKAKTRIYEIKSLLIRELVKNNTVRSHLPIDLRLSLLLRSSFPFKITQAVYKLIRIIRRLPIFFKKIKVSAS
ncbi:MAG: glycosyltransferase [Deltaproteobacteria bacterium]|nr:glycosyltransferase [Deltaproteobacteria bacterium]